MKMILSKEKKKGYTKIVSQILLCDKGREVPEC